MTPVEFSGLSEGDKIRHNALSDAFTIVANYGDRFAAVHVTHVSNPQEWTVEGADVRSIRRLIPGMIIRHKMSDRPLVVSSMHSKFVFAVETVCITIHNSDDWELVVKATLQVL
jgi:hypothetical protein